MNKNYFESHEDPDVRDLYKEYEQLLKEKNNSYLTTNNEVGKYYIGLDDWIDMNVKNQFVDKIINGINSRLQNFIYEQINKKTIIEIKTIVNLELKQIETENLWTVKSKRKLPIIKIFEKDYGKLRIACERE